MNEAEEIKRLKFELEVCKEKLVTSMIQVRKLKAILNSVSNFLQKEIKED